MKKAVFYLITGFTTNISIAQNVGIGTVSPQSQLSVGSNSQFRVETSGNISRINNVPYSFPASQGISGKTLVNDGSGNLSWKEAGVPIGSTVLCSYFDTASLMAKGFYISGISEMYARSRISRTGIWTPFANSIPTTGGFYMQDNPTVYSGTEMLVYYNNYVYKWNPSTTVWTQSAINPIAGYLPGSGASAAWSGTEMIIYGGNSGGISNKGVKYNPGTNTWTAIANGPYKKTNHSAVFTGTEMIVFGGDTCSCVLGSTQSGYKYNVATNTWSAAISIVNAPSNRAFHAAVWDGTRMIINGGRSADDNSTGGCYLYNSITNTWSFASSPFYNLSQAKAVWTGNEMLVWGSVFLNQTSNYYDIGLVYTPSTNSWTEFATEGHIPNNDSRSNIAWTGTQMLMVRGSDAQKFSYTGSGNFIGLPYLSSYYIMTKITNN